MTQRWGLLLSAVLVCVGTVHVHAWGGAGHRIVSRVALSQLTPAAKQLVREDASSIDVVRWSLEGRDIAVASVYTYAGFKPGVAQVGPAQIDAVYQRATQAIVHRQLMRAGVRLARILNDVAERVGDRR